MSALGELEQVVCREGEVEASDREQAGFPILGGAELPKWHPGNEVTECL